MTLKIAVQLGGKKPSIVRWSSGLSRYTVNVEITGSNPNLIILDEPTAGLDPSNQETVWNMIEGVQAT